MTPHQRAPIQHSPMQTFQSMSVARLTTVDSLPDEILGEIFTCLRDDAPSFRTDNHSPMEVEMISLQKIEWVTVTHVCRRWRSVAISISTLWNEPLVLLPMWAFTMLERSRMAAIQSLDLNWRSMPEVAISLAIRHTPRVKKLALRLIDNSRFETTLLREFTGVEAPRMLEDFTIYPLYGSTEMIRDPSYSGVCLPDDLLTNAKSLKSLNLQAMGINWTSHLLSSLTRLILIKVPYSRRPTVLQLRSMLERMPDIQVLALKEVLPVAPSTADISLRNKRVPLPELRQLIISGSSIELKAFISNVAPGSKLDDLEILICHEGDTTDELNGFQRALTEQCPLQDISNLAVYDEGGGWWTFEATTRMKGLSVGQEPLRWKFNLCGQQYLADDGLFVQDNHYALRFVQLFDTINWKTLYSLDLVSMDRSIIVLPSLSPVLARTFGMLPSLRMIATGMAMARLLMDALKYEVATEDGEGSPATPFPGLKSIYVVNVSFFDEDTSKPHLHMKELVECLRGRLEKGSPIHAITIENCTGILQTEAHELKSVAPGLVICDWIGHAPIEIGALAANRTGVCCSVEQPESHEVEERP